MSSWNVDDISLRFGGSDPGRPGTGGHAERVDLHAGRLEAGPRTTGGFAIHATSRSAGRNMIRVITADDQALVRGGMRMVLQAQSPRGPSTALT